MSKRLEMAGHDKRTIAGFPDYKVDRFGNIWSYRTNVEQILSPAKDRHGLLVINLYDAKGKRRQVRVHKAVQAAFLGPTPENMVLYHVNLIKTDNAVTNLKFIDRKELGRKTGHKSKQKSVIKIDPVTGEETIYRSAREAGRCNYLSYQTIIDRCNCRYWRNGKWLNYKSETAPDGYIYRWEDE